MKNPTLDRKAIEALLATGYTKSQLADVFAVSRQRLLMYLRGIEPHHPGITLFINYHAKQLLAR